MKREQTDRGLIHQTISGVLWTVWGKGGYALLNLLALVVLARLVSPADFGVMSAAVLIMELSGIFAQLGLGPAVVQRQHLELRHLQAAFTGSLALGCLIAAGIWLVAPIAADFFQSSGLAPVLRVLAFVFPLRGTAAVAESLMLRDLRFRWLANLDVAVFAGSQALVAVPLALTHHGAWALVGALIAQIVVRSAVLLYVRPPTLCRVPDQGALRDMLHFGGGFTIARLANHLALQGDNLVVGHWLGPNALGQYGRAYSLMAVPASTMGNVLDAVLFPTMARIQDDLRRLGAAYQRGIAVIALVALPASAVLVVLAPELVRVALGPGWLEVVAPFQVLAMGTLFRTSYKMSDSLARSTGVVYRRARRQIVYAVLVIGGAFVGQRWGITGVAFGVLGALGVNYLLMAQLSLQVCRISWPSYWNAQRPGLLLAVVSGIVAWATATALRHWALPALAVAIAATAAALGCALCLAWRFPRTCLGPDGLWTVEAVAGFFRKAHLSSGSGVARAEAG